MSCIRPLTAVSVLVVAAILSACATEPTPTPVPPTPTPVPPTAAEVLLDARDAMTDAGSAWFEIKHENGYLPLSGVQVTELEGAVNADGADLMASASLGRLYIELQVILVDGGVWITNPLTGTWEDAGDPDQPIVWSLVDGITSIFDNVTNPEFVEDPSDGSDYVIGSDVPAAIFNDLFFGSVTSTENVYATAKVDRASSQVRELVIEGQLTSDDTWDTKRTLSISRHGESFDIKAPQ